MQLDPSPTMERRPYRYCGCGKGCLPYTCPRSSARSETGRTVREKNAMQELGIEYWYALYREVSQGDLFETSTERFWRLAYVKFINDEIKRLIKNGAQL